MDEITEVADLPTWQDRDAEADALRELWVALFGED